MLYRVIYRLVHVLLCSNSCNEYIHNVNVSLDIQCMGETALEAWG